AAIAGAEVASSHFRTGLEVEMKQGKTDVVTRADRETQRRIIEVLREEFPEDAIVSEEEDELKSVPDSGAAWIIDPIDGTNNFVRDVPIWATSVAVVNDGKTMGAANVLPELEDRYVSDGTDVTLNGTRVTVSDRSDPETFRVCPVIWWPF
ncbi:MAG: inositol monophosphatase, partial [Halobacteriaceae archaeon]